MYASLKSKRPSESTPDWINDEHAVGFPEHFAAKPIVASTSVRRARAELTQKTE
jgi:hypothetical protein